jgi:hypothetical protein
MSKKKHQAAQPAPIGAPETDAAPAHVSGLTKISLRMSAGKHAVRAAEAEVHVDGARIAGGEGVFEFDLFAETWVEIHIVRS